MTGSLARSEPFPDDRISGVKRVTSIDRNTLQDRVVPADSNMSNERAADGQWTATSELATTDERTVCRERDDEPEGNAFPN